MSKLIFTTDAGLEIQYEPASALQIEMSEKGILKRFRSDGKSIDPPTYEVETAGAGKQTFVHDEKTAIQSPETQAAWEKYLADYAECQQEMTRVRNEILLDAILVDLPADSSWEARQKKRYIDVPADPDEKRRHYVQTEILKTVSDVYGITEVIMVATLAGAVSEEAIQAASATFRNSKSALKNRPDFSGEPAPEETGEMGTQ